MRPNHHNQINLITFLVAFFSLVTVFGVQAQHVDEVRWKSEAQVRALYGDPDSISQPTGTHASYVMWNYPEFTVAFANNKAFHLFKKDSLKKTFELNENR